MAASRPMAQLHEKSNFVCCSDASRRVQAAVPSSSEAGTSLPQCNIPRRSSLQQSAVSIHNVGKSARPETRKPIEKPAPRSHLPQRTAPPPASSAKERESKISSSMQRAATSSAKQATHAPRQPACSQSHPPQRTAEAATSSVKERALKTSSSLPRTATSSVKQAATARNPIENPSPHRPQPLQRSSSAGMSSANQRTSKASSSMPSQRPAPPAATTATCSARDRALKTSPLMSRAEIASAKQPSHAAATLKARRTMTATMTQTYARPTRKSPGSAVSRRKETPPVAAPRTARKPVVTAGEKDEKEASVWVDKKELASASYIEVPVHDVSQVNSDPLPEILEPSSPPMQRSPHGSNADGDDHDRDDFDVSGDEQELLVSPSSAEGWLHAEPEVENDPVQELQGPSSPPEQASQLTSSVEEGSDRDRDDIDVPEYEQEHACASSTECPADDEPEASRVPVHEQRDEPSSPTMQAAELTSSVDESDRDRDDNDVPRYDELLQLQSSKEKPVAEISSREQGRAQKEEGDAEYNQTSPEIIDSPARDISLSTARETLQAKGEAEIGNEMIEERRTKLLAKQKSKVRALVGAFETVISLHYSDGGQTDQSLEKITQSRKSVSIVNETFDALY